MTTDFIQTTEDYQLKQVFIRPEHPNNKGILFIHGFGTHAEFYRKIFSYYSNLGYYIAAIDLPGHGESFGEKGILPSAYIIKENIRFWANKVMSEYKSIDWMVLGVGIGATIGVHALDEDDYSISGWGLISPVLKLTRSFPKVIQEMSKYVSSITPTIAVLTVDYEKMWTDEKVSALFMNDEKCYHGKVKAKTISVITELYKSVQRKSKFLKRPVWIAHGTNETFCQIDASKEFYKKIDNECKSWMVYQEGSHDLFHEPNGEVIMHDFHDWIAKKSDC